MTFWQGENWAWKDPADVVNIQDGDVFINCNLVQFVPHTELFTGLSELVFIDCNLVNVDLPGDSKTESCLTMHHIYEINEKRKSGEGGDVDIKNSLEKSVYIKPSDAILDDIFASDEVTNKMVLESYQKRIRRAKENIKSRKVSDRQSLLRD